jgi:hypothetical protein
LPLPQNIADATTVNFDNATVTMEAKKGSLPLNVELSLRVESIELPIASISGMNTRN